jgi:hypothetical protein
MQAKMALYSLAALPAEETYLNNLSSSLSIVSSAPHKQHELCAVFNMEGRAIVTSQH